MAGDDSLFGEGGNARIAGGSGDDTLDGGRDANTIQGHSGADLIDAEHQDVREMAGKMLDVVERSGKQRKADRSQQ
ncbi:MAG: hypothetical protein ACKVHE_36720 [Planctomycetales bacterium]